MESCLQCPITALSCYNDLLLTGQKSKILVYCLSTHKLMCTKKIFKRNSIHKICEIQAGLFLIIGGKSIRKVKVEYGNGKELSIEFQSDEKEFKVWIWDAIHIEDNNFLLISIHNTSVIWNSVTGDTFPIASCSEQCILYSARLKKVDKDEVLVAAGTVFNQVLLWKTTYNYQKQHHFINDLKRFCGHEGVIFSLRFHPTLNQLLSVSDDRSIRIWSIDEACCMQILYGHTARVWDAYFLPDGHRIVSIGEDAACIIWNCNEGTILKKFEGHKGKSIWSMAIDDRFIFTGGGDGGIRQWPLETSAKRIQTRDTLLPINHHQAEVHKEKDFPRIIKFLDKTHLIVFTNNGSLLTHDVETSSWDVLHHDPSYYTYCVLDLSDELVAFSNLTGMVKILHLGNNENVLTHQVFEQGKVFSLTLLKFGNQQQFLLACGPEGELNLFKIILTMQQNPTALRLIASFVLPHSKQRWITDAVLIFSDGDGSDCWKLVCGDRRGSLHLFDSSSHEPRHSALGVHGKTGVTSVTQHGPYLYTTGRDGNFRKYQILQSEIVLVDKQKVCKGLDWIEGLWFDNSDIVVYGFYLQSHFAMWSYTKNEIVLKIQCGGGYRSWDVKLPDKAEKELQFSYLKGPVINMASTKKHTSDESLVFKEGIHGKEVLCAQLLGYQNAKDSNEKEWLIATGSEDTTVNFLSYNESRKELKLLHTAVGHIGGVKDISFLSSMTPKQKQHGNQQKHKQHLNGHFVSCGSRTSLKKWSLACPNFTAIPLSTILDATQEYDGCIGESDDVTCCLQSEIFNPEMNPKQLRLRTGEFIDDMRFMSCDSCFLNDDNSNNSDVIVCVCACSDGAVRIYVLDNGCNDIELLCIVGDKKHCFQTVKTLRIATSKSTTNIVVMATSTDGFLSMWDITGILASYRDKRLVLCDQNDAKSKEKEMISSSNQRHVNKNRYKFHELEAPLFTFTSDREDSDKSLCFHHRLHQSGINSLDVVVVSAERKDSVEWGSDSTISLMVATGGDDNAVSVSTLEMCHGSSSSIKHGGFQFKLADTKSRSDAHISSITGVKFANLGGIDYVISTSVDQMVKMWNVKENPMIVAKEIFTDVADVSNLEVWCEGDKIHMIVTGFGIEIISLKMTDL